MAFLQREISLLASVFTGATHVIPYVPAHTIYGFLCTVGLPAKLGVPIMYPSEVNWKSLPPGALVVATPFHWQLLVGALPDNSAGCLRVSAAAPLHTHLFKQVAAKNIVLTELYGSTETAGAGIRRQWQQPFAFFPYWRCIDWDGAFALEDMDNRRVYPLMDEIAMVADGQFKVLGRKDGRVKIAGMLVDPAAVQAAILGLPNVEDCSVIAKAIDGEVKIYAVVTLHASVESERLSIKTKIRQIMSPHERPARIDFTNEAL